MKLYSDDDGVWTLKRTTIDYIITKQMYSKAQNDTSNKLERI